MARLDNEFLPRYYPQGLLRTISVPHPLLWTLGVALVISIPFLLFSFGWLGWLGYGKRASPFRFLDLPVELREMVYEHLIERSPEFPMPPARPKPLFSVSRLAGRRRPSKGNRIMLVNRQLYQEFMAYACKSTTFTLKIGESYAPNSKLWAMTPETMARIRRCDLRIVAPSSMLGQFHADMENEILRLRGSVEKNMEAMGRLERLTLHIRASNPLWLWFYGSQEFKTASGLPFAEITLSSDCWTRGENHLARADSGKWEWRCPSGHFVADGHREKQQIREFCACLYAQCHKCEGS